MGVHLGLDRGDVVGRQRGRVRIIEAQAVGGDEAALLRDVAAEAVAQRGVEQMGRAVVGAGRVAALDIDRLVERVADLERALGDAGAQRVKLAERFRRVLNIAFEAIERGQFSGVADLPAAFAVEGRLVEDHGHRFARRGAVDARAVLDQGEHDALAFVARVAGEFGRADFLGEVVPQIVAGGFARALPRGARGGFLLGHGGVEAGAVDGEAAGAQRVLGQVVGEAEGVVELERGRAGERVALAPSCRSLRRAA